MGKVTRVMMVGTVGTRAMRMTSDGGAGSGHGS
jgi:hypothetical protein